VRSPGSATPSAAIPAPPACTPGYSAAQSRATRAKLQAHHAPEREVRSHQQGAPLARSEINESEIFKRNISVRKACGKPFWLDRRIVTSLNPVWTVDIEVAQIGPAGDVTVGVDPVRPIEPAALPIGTQRPRHPVLLHQMDRQQQAAAQAGQHPRSAGERRMRGTTVRSTRGI